jgi:ADP-ribosyl-[dinitrogen reductase] hydrolase
LQVGVNAPDANGFSIFDNVRSADRVEVMRLAGKDPRASRAVGALVGMAVADSVGAPLEFLPVGKSGSRFDPKTLKVTGEFNKFSLKPGQWTDDTSMGLCVADSLLACGTYDGSDIRVRFWNWWNRGYNNAFRRDKDRHKSVGLGGNIGLSLHAIRSAGPPARFESASEDAGIGSLMRLAPVPVYFHRDVDLAMKVSAESSYTTHPGPTAAEACGFLGFVIVRAIMGERVKGETAAHFLNACVEAYLERSEVKSQPTLARLLRSAEPEGSTERLWNWKDPAGPFLEETVAARGYSYNGYPVQAGYVGGYSMDGLAMALHSVYHTKSFMGALARCVNLLGDADSTGSICGQIAGAFYGIGAVDSRLIARLEKWDAGEVALRGALLYALGDQMSEETMNHVRDKTLGALSGLPNSSILSPSDENCMKVDSAAPMSGKEPANKHVKEETKENAGEDVADATLAKSAAKPLRSGDPKTSSRGRSASTGRKGRTRKRSPASDLRKASSSSPSPGLPSLPDLPPAPPPSSQLPKLLHRENAQASCGENRRCSI